MILPDASGTSIETTSRPRHSIAPWRPEWLVSAAVFCWPFAFLFPYVFPARGRFLAVGNDFHILYYWYKVYLLDVLSHFALPLWSPSEAAGFPFYSNPFTQTFYPLNVPLAVYYKLAGGYQVIDHQRYAVLGIAIFSLGLFRWLRLLRLPVHSAMFAAMVMSVSFKLTELLRFPNALHTAAWFPWVLFSFTRLVWSTSTRERVASAVMLAAALICLLTGGYPYYVFYSPWLFGPYLAILLLPPLSIRAFGREPKSIKASVAALAIVGTVTAAICGPYLYKMAALMQQTTDRSGQSFLYSTAHVFDYEDTIGSWVFPPASQMEGWYYFGMISVLLILLSVLQKRGLLQLMLLAWIGLITYITYGRSSYLFIFLWCHVPMFSSLRVWSRMNIILVPILAWLLALAYAHFESLLFGKTTEEVATERQGFQHWPLVILTVTYAAALGAQLYLWIGRRYDVYWTLYYAGAILPPGMGPALPNYLRRLGVETHLTPEVLVGYAERAAIVCGVVAFAALSALLLSKRLLRNGGSRLRHAVMAGVLTLATIDLWMVGPWAWSYTIFPLWKRVPVDVAARNAESSANPRVDGQGLSPNATFYVGVMDNWYFKRYVDFLTRASEEPAEKRYLLGMVDGRKVFFSERIDHSSIRAFLDDARRFAGVEHIARYTGDRLVVRVIAPGEGFVSFIDNWDPDWEATVNGAPAQIERLLGTFKSVRVRGGTQTVRFTYRPIRLWTRH